MPYGKKSPTKMGHSPAEMSPYKMGHSPAEMGHSPMENQNKGYAKQERKDLMQDMPIVKDAMGGRSWMSKHSNSALNFNSPKHKHTHPKGDDRAYKGHTGNAPTSSNTSKKDLAKMGSKAAPQMGHESPAEMHGGFHAGDAAKAFAGTAIKTAKKVKAAGSKIAKAISADLFEGGSERKRKLRADRGGAKPAKVFKK